MTNERPTLEKELSSLTEPVREEPVLWQAAVERSEWEAATSEVKGEGASWSIEKLVPLALAAVLVAALSLGLWQTLSNDGVPTLSGTNDNYGDYVPNGDTSAPSRASEHRSFQTSPGANGQGGGGGFTDMPNQADEPSFAWQSGQDETAAGERHVVRRVNMAITVSDVRTAYQSALHLVSEVKGEFVESSALLTEQDQLRGELKIRVRVERLSPVLNDLRALGVVNLEQAAGDDVSEQLVDLDARLRNERRVEAELLELLESRNDAPLEDVLKLREQLNRIRGQIERLDGQSAYLKQQVALAAIQITLHPKPTESDEDGVEEESAGLGALFFSQIGGGWSDELETLIRTLGATVRILIGGLIWWALLVLVVWVVRHRLEQRAALT